MPAFNARMQLAALALLTTYGEPINVSRVNVAYLVPTTGNTIEGTPTVYTGVGHPSTYPEQYTNNVTVFQTDIKLLFYSLTLPQPGDIFTLGGTNYTAIDVERHRAQGADVYYTIQLRQ